MIASFEEYVPTIADSAFIAPSADVMGRVTLGEDSSVWYGCVLRGDVATITIGARTNIQDLSVVHVTGGVFDTIIGDDVTVGHRAILHGCSIAHHVLVGMGAVITDGAILEPYCMVGAGAVVSPNTRIPEGFLALGVPAKVVRPITEMERAQIDASAQAYAALARSHRDTVRPFHSRR